MDVRLLSRVRVHCWMRQGFRRAHLHLDASAHGRDKGEGGVCNEDGSGWKCDCAAGYRCVMNCCPYKKNKMGHVCKADGGRRRCRQSGCGFRCHSSPSFTSYSSGGYGGFSSWSSGGFGGGFG